MKLGLNHISASSHIGFGKYGGHIERLLLAPSKNEFRMCWSTCMPNFMLVDKSAHLPLRAWTSQTTFSAIVLLSHHSGVLGVAVSHYQHQVAL